MPTEVIIKYTRIGNEQLTNVNKEVTNMEGKEIAELMIYDTNYHQREFMKDGLDEATRGLITEVTTRATRTFRPR